MATMTEQQAYEQYVKACHSVPHTYVSEFNFTEWQNAGRPKGPAPTDGSFGPCAPAKEV